MEQRYEAEPYLIWLLYKRGQGFELGNTATSPASDQGGTWTQEVRITSPHPAGYGFQGCES